MRCFFFKLVVYYVFAIYILRAEAADLLEIYRQGLANDPIFKQAYSVYMSQAEAIIQARSQLYPQLTISAQLSSNAEATNTVNPFFYPETNYNNNQWQLTTSQTLFNYQAWAEIQQAKASVKAAQASFNDATQDLMLRVAHAYFQVLLAYDTLSFAQAKQRANQRQLIEAKQRLKVGLTAITAVYEAQAAYDQSIATVIAARNNQINKNEELRLLTNHTYKRLAPIRNHKFSFIKPEPYDIDEWVHTALAQNYKLFAAKYMLEAARANIKVKSAASWPVFSIQGSAQSNNNVYFVSNRQSIASLAIAMNYPIFQGGLVQSLTRQAQYDFQTASGKLEQVYRTVIVNSRIAFNTIVDGISKVKADIQTVISEKKSQESTEAQFQVGIRTMVDVVNAQRRLFTAQEELARDQYDLIYAVLNLKYLAGTLSLSDLEKVNASLEMAPPT